MKEHLFLKIVADQVESEIMLLILLIISTVSLIKYYKKEKRSLRLRLLVKPLITFNYCLIKTCLTKYKAGWLFPNNRKEYFD